MLPNPFGDTRDWKTFTGTSVVRKVWDGRANLGELEVANATSHIEALTLRIFDRRSQTWNVYFANAKSGSLDPTPMVGRFEGGRGLFYATENVAGRTVRVRFVFSDVTPRTFDLTQAFSSDGGRIWNDNWYARFAR